jgi:hypothetical protein
VLAVLQHTYLRNASVVVVIIIYVTVGCQSSKNTPPNTSRNVTEGTGAPLSNQEILERIDAPVKSETLEIGGFKVRSVNILNCTKEDNKFIKFMSVFALVHRAGSIRTIETVNACTQLVCQYYVVVTAAQLQAQFH